MVNSSFEDLSKFSVEKTTRFCVPDSVKKQHLESNEAWHEVKCMWQLSEKMLWFLFEPSIIFLYGNCHVKKLGSHLILNPDNNQMRVNLEVRMESNMSVNLRLRGSKVSASQTVYSMQFPQSWSISNWWKHYHGHRCWTWSTSMAISVRFSVRFSILVLIPSSIIITSSHLRDLNSKFDTKSKLRRPWGLQNYFE